MIFILPLRYTVPQPAMSWIRRFKEGRSNLEGGCTLIISQIHGDRKSVV
jgi:hypothetical protein